MPAITYETLLKKRSVTDSNKGMPSDNVDKSSHFYHVMTRAWGYESIFTFDVAQYRQRLLGRLCEERGIIILFSVTMPNHTHEVFMANRWEDIRDVLRVINSQIARLVRKTKKWKTDRKVFERHTLYVPIKDIGQLLYVGKYIFDNPAGLKAEGKPVPFSCFWMFENAHLGIGYDTKLYEKLFGLEIPTLIDLYTKKTKKEVLEYSNKLAKTWTTAQTEAVFLAESTASD